MRRLAIASVAALMFAAPAMAAECTADLEDAKTKELIALVGDDEAKADKLDGYIEKVHAEYGGEPSDEKACEALDKLIAMMKADG